MSGEIETDLVRTLREIARDKAEKLTGTGIVARDLAEWLAADEITRLREALATITDATVIADSEQAEWIFNRAMAALSPTEEG